MTEKQKPTGPLAQLPQRPNVAAAASGAVVGGPLPGPLHPTQALVQVLTGERVALLNENAQLKADLMVARSRLAQFEQAAKEAEAAKEAAKTTARKRVRKPAAKPAAKTGAAKKA